jgi:hypothetical protein
LSLDNSGAETQYFIPVLPNRILGSPSPLFQLPLPPFS